MLLGTSCAVSGTGFLFSREILKKNRGWKFYLLTEDIEFTVNSVINGEKIGYCKTAVIYDEQPLPLSSPGISVCAGQEVICRCFTGMVKT
jgi:cellulose synthase/poly-beta-1,6-N-acetylglucosamine synthase-like glycosyltransferase